MKHVVPIAILLAIPIIAIAFFRAPRVDGPTLVMAVAGIFLLIAAFGIICFKNSKT